MLTFPRAVDDPRQLPELRAALIELAAPDGSWETTEINRAVLDMPGPVKAFDRNPDTGDLSAFYDRGYGPDELESMIELAVGRGRNGAKWFRTCLAEAQLVYVTAEMTDVVEAAAASVPDGLTLYETDAPAQCGLVVFGRPVYGTDVIAPDVPIRLDGLCWGPCRLPPPDVDWQTYREPFTVPAVGIGMFRMAEPAHLATSPDTGLESMIRAHGHGGFTGPLWLPLGRTDWPWGDAVEQPTNPALVDSVHWPSMMEDRRLLIALFGVINQKRLVEVAETTADRPARRRLERAGHGGRDERVKVIHLRRTAYEGRPVTEPSGRHVRVRFPVKPFWRRQVFGPGRSQRRLILVPGHWRGPEGAPVVHAERIWELDR